MNFPDNFSTAAFDSRYGRDAGDMPGRYDVKEWARQQAAKYAADAAASFRQRFGIDYDYDDGEFAAECLIDMLTEAAWDVVRRGENDGLYTGAGD